MVLGSTPSKRGLDVNCRLEDLQCQNDHQGYGDCDRYTLWGKAHALDSLLGNADGADGTTHARVGVAA